MNPRKSIQTLEFRNITFGFDAGAKVFENVSIAMPNNRAVWIRSPGGRGKSTLLRLLSGMLAPQKGDYLINGENVSQMSFEDFLPYRLNMGYGFDMGGLLNNKSLAENLILPLLYHGMMSPKDAFDHVSAVTDSFGMQEHRDHRPFAVSGSLRKLTCVLRAFVHSPQVVFLDDPVIGLKRDHLTDLLHFVDERFASHGLRQIFFTSESQELADKLNAQELLISEDWFTVKAVA